MSFVNKFTNKTTLVLTIKPQTNLSQLITKNKYDVLKKVKTSYLNPYFCMKIEFIKIKTYMIKACMKNSKIKYII